MTERLTMEQLERAMAVGGSQNRAFIAISSTRLILTLARRGLLPTEFETAVDEGREARRVAE